MTVHPETIELELRHGLVCGQVWGNPQGEPVLALHGWLDNSSSFARLAPLLKSYRVVAVDLPGHGWSDHRPADTSYLFLHWVRDVFEIAAVLKWDSFILLGHSMGAAIASMAAGTFPERINKLVLLEGLGPAVDPEEKIAEGLRAWIEQDLGEQREERPVYKSASFVAQRLRAKLSDLSEESSHLLVKRGLEDVEGGVTWRADRRLRGKSPMRLSEKQVHVFLRSIRCPVLLFWAEDGWPFEAQVMRERVDCVRGLVVKKVEGGHHVHMERQELIAKEINDFLA